MRIVFMGTPEFAVPALERLIDSEHQLLAVVTRPDRPRGRGLKLEPSPVKQCALSHRLKVLQPEKLDDHFLADLRGRAPDLIVVIAFGQILKPEILSLPRDGCLNLHASLLPKFRGAAPIAWAILQGESETGVTAMQMDEGLDTGPILMQKRLPIAPEDTAGSLHDKLAGLSAELLAETLVGLKAGTLSATPQDHGRASYAPSLKKEQGRLDWRKPALELERMVRAFNPWPGCFFQLSGHAVKVWKTRVVPVSGAPGELLSLAPEGITVACGEDALQLLELQPSGKRRMSAGEFLCGHRLRPGTLLVE